MKLCNFPPERDMTSFMKKTNSSHQPVTLKSVLDESKILACIPEWEELLEFEYAREKGEVNMITDNILKYALDHGLVLMACWLQRCVENKVAWITVIDIGIEEAEKIHGPRQHWLTQEHREMFLMYSILTQERNLKKQLRELARRASIKKKD